MHGQICEGDPFKDLKDAEAGMHPFLAVKSIMVLSGLMW